MDKEELEAWATTRVRRALNMENKVYFSMNSRERAVKSVLQLVIETYHKGHRDGLDERDRKR